MGRGRNKAAAVYRRCTARAKIFVCLSHLIYRPLGSSAPPSPAPAAALGASAKGGWGGRASETHTIPYTCHVAFDCRSSPPPYCNTLRPHFFISSLRAPFDWFVSVFLSSTFPFTACHPLVQPPPPPGVQRYGFEHLRDEGARGVRATARCTVRD